MSELPIIALRSLAGGTLVVTFALISEPLKPKTFAGIFGAAPSIAMASLTITLLSQGPAKASEYASGMLLGAVAMIAYALTTTAFTKRLGALPAAIANLAAWLAVAGGLFLGVWG